MKSSEIHYNQLTDKEIVRRILAEPSDEDAAYFLIHSRYRPLVCKCCIKIFSHLRWLEDCEQELFLYLKGNDNKWNRLRNISNLNALGGWMNQTVYRRLNEIKPQLLGHWSQAISIENDSDGTAKIQLPDKGNEEYEQQERRLQIIEAITLLKNQDQKLVILKSLKGYQSKEIAEMLQKKWNAEGVVKIDKGKLVVPSAAYVNVLRQRAIVELKKIINDPQYNS